MAKAFYTQAGGQFHLNREKNEQDLKNPALVGDAPTLIEHSSEQVAVAYVKLPDRLHIFTHGTAAGMQGWLTTHNSVCKPGHQATLKLFDQSAPIATVNKAIEDPEFLSTLL
jgi:hypothetical protein